MEDENPDKNARKSSRHSGTSLDISELPEIESRKKAKMEKGNRAYEGIAQPHFYDLLENLRIYALENCVRKGSSGKLIGVWNLLSNASPALKSAIEELIAETSPPLTNDFNRDAFNLKIGNYLNERGKSELKAHHDRK